MTTSALAPLPSPFALYRGGRLIGGSIRYESWGKLSADKDNAILLFTGLSPSAHAASSSDDPQPGWWEGLIGPDAPLDTNKFCVICVNSLGSCFGSTGPTSVDPLTGSPYAESFPEIALEDIASGGCAVLDSLGIAKAQAVIGPSLGGSVVLAFVAMYPSRARRLLSISGTMAASAHAIALRSIQREAVSSDPVTGLRLARKLGTISYRSTKEFKQRFQRERSKTGRDFLIEDYLEQQADKFAGVFDPVSYLRLSRAIDLFDLNEHGPPAQLFESAKLESALVIGIEEDWLFTIDEQADLAHALQAAGIAVEFQRLSSLYGHDAFLAESSRFGAIIKRWLSRPTL
jgi:homoserine O-acetyltransferase